MKKRALLERLRLKKQGHSLVVGVAWYSEDCWRRVKAAAADPDRFEATYPEWWAMATEAIGKLKQVGVNPLKVLVDADELSAWCQLHNKPNNAESRAEFVSRKAHVPEEA